MSLAVIVLAAGKGKRMASSLPKVLHPLGGRPLLRHVLDTASGLGAVERIVVHGHGGDAVKAACPDDAGLGWVEQAEQLGTGHAVAQALPALRQATVALVLYGDVPLIRAETLQPLVTSAEAGRLAVLTVEFPDPTGYGRVIRDAAGRVLEIVEEKDATAEQCRVREINSGILAAPVDRLRAWVRGLNNTNAQGEYYLTDVIALAVAEGVEIEAFTALDPSEVKGVNDRIQLAELERCHQRRQAEALMRNGAALLDPERVDIRGTVSTGQDVIIDVNVVFEGTVRLGDRVRIGPHSFIRDAVLGDDVEVLSHCCIEEAEIGPGARVGPFSRLRPGACLANDVHVGNFVEIKKSFVGQGSKVNHLTYVGDSEIGVDVNVGAGTITCNYDGANKHKTIIEDRAFIGSNTALVAPVRVGADATIGAGSTINRDVPAGSLALTRASQKTIAAWSRPTKKKP